MKQPLLRACSARILRCIGLFLLFSLIIPLNNFAQTKRTVSGVITDANKAPMQGVSVVIKGSTRGTATDQEGRYSISDVPSNATLVFSFTGYGSQEVNVGNKATINVNMSQSAVSMNEVVVVGYGTRQKRDVTGAVSSVKASRLENENPASVQDVIRGNVPGVNVTQSTSAKGGGDLLVRGKSSINAGTSPLIVLDGVIYPGALSDINPNDIATIDVLKDASSAAVFGAKAASGVILITTKKGSSGKPQITVNSNIGVVDIAADEELYDGPGFVAWRRDVQRSRNISSTKLYIYDNPDNLPAGVTLDMWYNGLPTTNDKIDVWLDRLGLKPVEIANYKKGKTINWYDLMFQTGLRQDHTVSMSGRKEDVSYYMSVGYTDNEGVIVGDRFKTFRTRLNLEGKAAKWLTAGMNLQFADRDESQVPVTWERMINASPYGEIYNDDGITLRDSPNDDLGNNLNPFADNTYTNRLQKYNTLFGSLYVKGDLPYGFSYQVNFTPNFEFYRYFNGVSAVHPSYRVRKGVATRTTQTTFNWQIDNLLMWNKTFGEHKIDATFLLNAEKFQQWREQIDNEGFDPSDVLSYHNIGAGIKPIVSSDDQVSTGDALMGRINYSYKDRYLLTASVRRDGYSAFGQLNPRATFPAVAVSWVFTQEDFMKNASWLSYGKLRLSWGINGNRDIGRYLALTDLTSGKYQYISPSGTIIPVSQLWANRMQNDNLKWEQTTSDNIGFDFSILNNKISGSIDVYKKITKDLLILRSLPNPIAFDNVMFNLGSVQNKGLEISLNSTNVQNSNFSWRTSANFWLNRNEIKHLYGPVNIYDANGKVIGTEEKDDIGNKWFIGHDLDVVWDQKVLGVWQTSEAAEAAKYGVAPGDFRVEDVNGDFKYSDADRQFLGYSNPRFQWSLRNEFTVLKNIDFSFLLYSNWGQLRGYNQAKNNSGFQDRQNSYIFPYWTPENPINDYARLYSSNGSATYSVYRKASFIRLSTVALAYTVPRVWLDRAKIQSLKFYFNVNNAGIYSPDWTFWDAEYGNTPTPRYFTFGLNLTL